MHPPSVRPHPWPRPPLLPPPTLLALFATLATVSGSTSCALVDQLLASGLISPPKISFLGADLVRSPAQRELSAFYCPKVLSETPGLGLGAGFLCGKLFGPAPAEGDMTVGFDLRFDVANPNQIPLPLSEILTGLTIFPGATQQNLGAVCLSLCAPDDPRCAGGASNHGCEKASGDLKSLADFPAAALNVLVAQGIGAAGGKPAGFVLPKVLANSHLGVTARLALTPAAFLPAMRELARQSIGDLKAGRSPAFQIPYRLLGTVFADAGSLGRVATGFGPVAGIWPIPTQRLVP